ncbi:hypothetical protein CENSYa_0849 [Cenarchaeum symbiosum A]|uniref:Uncharacterized protein n=1 Tax=Cenarchaeum symbiosum (strain A) TaxID=414004 RepID=A0RVW5_CENSY|nr:hypothetical protein CENSYa_0849 [Cenarchaeum symbiosum A]
MRNMPAGALLAAAPAIALLILLPAAHAASVTSAVLDLRGGALEIAFDTDIDISEVVPDRFHLRDGLSSRGITLSASEFSTFSDTDVIRFNLSPLNRVALTGQLAPHLHFDSGALSDVDGVEFPVPFALPPALSFDRYNVNLPVGQVYTRDVDFSPDGTIMLVLVVPATSTESVRMYALSEPFDVTTAVLSDTLEMTNVVSGATELLMTPDGLNMYLSTSPSSNVHHYTLEEPFNVTGAARAGQFRINEPIITGMAFSGNGSYAFVLSRLTDEVTRWALSTPFDLSSRAADGEILDVDGPGEHGWGLYVTSDGRKVFVGGEDADRVHSYELGSPHDLGTGVYTGSIAIPGMNDITGIEFTPGGGRVIVVGETGRRVVSQELHVPYGASLRTNFLDTLSVEENPEDFEFVLDGRRMFLVGFDLDRVRRYNLGTAYDIGSAQPTNAFNARNEEDNPRGLAISDDGQSFFVIGNERRTVQEYTVGSPFVLVNTLVGSSYPTGLSTAEDVEFSPDGTSMFVASEDIIHSFSLGTAFDETTASAGAQANLSAQETGLTGVTFSADGTKMAVTGSSSRSIHSYDLGSPFAASTAAHTGSMSVRTDGIPTGLGFAPGGLVAYVTIRDPGAMIEYTLNTQFVAICADDMTVSGGECVEIERTEYARLGSAVLNGTELRLYFDAPVAFAGMGIRVTDGPLPEGGVELAASELATGSASILSFELSGPRASEIAGYADPRIHTDPGAISGTGGEVFPEPYGLGTTGYRGMSGYLGALDTSAQSAAPMGAAMAEDGSGVLVLGGTTLFRYRLDAAFDVDSAVHISTRQIGGREGSPTGLAVSPDGAIIMVSGAGGIHTYSADNAFGAGGISYLRTFDVGDNVQEPLGVALSAAGDRLFVSDGAAGAVNAYDLLAPYNTNGAQYAGSFSTAVQDGDPSGISISPDGLRVLVAGGESGRIHEYELLAPLLAPGAAHTGSFAVEGPPSDISLDSVGLRMLSTGGGTVHHYSLNVHPVHVVQESPRVVSASLDLPSDTLEIAFDRGIAGIDPSGIYLADAPGHTGGTSLGAASVVINGTVARLELAEGTAALYQDPVLRFEQGALPGPGGVFPEPAGEIPPVYRELHGLADNTPTGLAFSGNGMRMFVSGSSTDTIRQYDLLSPYLPAGAEESGTFSVAAQESGPTGVAFSESGRRMFVPGSGADVHEYYLASQFNITGARHLGSYPTGAAEPVRNMLFSDGGTKMFIVGSPGMITGYNLDGPYRASSAVQADILDVSAQDAAVTGAAFSPDGMLLFVSGRDEDSIHRYSLVAPFALAGASHDETLYLGAEEGTPTGVVLAPGGLGLLVTGNDANAVHRYELAEPYSLSPAGGTSDFDVSADEGTPTGAEFSPDGTTMLIVGSDADAVVAYSLAEPFDVSSASKDRSFIIGGSPSGLALSPDGTGMVVSGGSGDIRRYSLGAPFELGDVSETGSFSVSEQESAPSAVEFAADGRGILVAGGSGNIHRYDLDSVFELVSPAYAGSFSVAAQESSPTGIALSPDGATMLITGTGSGLVHAYSLASPNDPATASYKWSRGAGTESRPQDVDLSSDGLSMYLVGDRDDTVVQYVPSLFYAASCTAEQELSSGICYTEVLSFEQHPADAPRAPDSATYSVSLHTMDTPLASDFDITSYPFVRGGDSPGHSEGAVITSDVATRVVSAVLNRGTGALDVTFDAGAALQPAAGAAAHIVDGAGPGGILLGDANVTGGVYRFIIDSPDVGLIARYADPRLHFGAGYLPAHGGETFPPVFALPLQVPSDSWMELDQKPYGLHFSPDGMIMFTADSAADAIKRYNLGTPYDITSAVLNETLGTVPQTAPQGVTLSEDGRVMFVSGAIPNEIRRYTLATPFVLNSSSLNGSIAIEGTRPVGIDLSPGGTRLYMAGSTTHQIRQYDLDPPYSITATPTGGEIYVPEGTISPSAINPQGVTVSPDGRFMIIAALDDVLYRYYLTEPFDVTSAVAAGTLDTSQVRDRVRDVGVSEDGRMIFVADEDDGVDRYDLGAPYDIAAHPYVPGLDLDVSTEDGQALALAFSSDGTSLFVLGDGGNMLHEYILGSPYAVHTAVIGSSHPITDAVGRLSGLAFSDDGSRYYLSVQGGGAVHQFDMSVPFDPATSTYAGFADLSGQGVSPTEVNIENGGRMMFALDRSPQTVRAYTLGTPYDVQDISPSASLDVSAYSTASTGMAFSEDGRRIFVIDGGNSTVHRFDMAAPFDLSGAAYVDSLDITSAGGRTHDVAFSAGGRLMFVPGIDDDAVYTFALSAPYDITPSLYVYNADVDGGAADGARGLAVGENGSAVAAAYNTGEVYWRGLAEPHNLATAGPAALAPIGGGSPAGLALSGGGERMFLADSNGTVVQYDLDGSYPPGGSVSAVLEAGQGGSICGIAFQAGGTQMMVAGGGSIYRYLLGTAYDISTAGAPFRHQLGPGVVPCGMAPSADGTGIVISLQDGSVHRYALGEPFNPGSRQAGPEGFNTRGIEARDVEFSADGTIMYLLDGGGSAHRYPAVSYSIEIPRGAALPVEARDGPGIDEMPSLRPNFTRADDKPAVSDRAVAAVPIASRVVSAVFNEDTGVLDVAFDATSSLMPSGSAYIGDGAASGGIPLEGGRNTGPREIQYEIGEKDREIVIQYADPRLHFDAGYLLSDDGGSFPPVFSLPPPVPAAFMPHKGIPQDAFLTPGGRMLFVADSQNNTIYRYMLDSPFDVASGVQDQSLDVSGRDSGLSGMDFSGDGTRLFITGTQNSQVHRFALEAPYSLEGSPAVDSTFQSGLGGPADVHFGEGGMRMYITIDALDRIFGYRLAAPYEIGAPPEIAGAVGVGAQDNRPGGIALSQDGRSLLMTGLQRDTVHRYYLAEPYSLTSAEIVGTVSTGIFAGDIVGNARGVAASADGTKILVAGDGGVAVYELGAPYDVSADPHVQGLGLDVSAEDNRPVALEFSADGTRLFMLGDSDNMLHRYDLDAPYAAHTAQLNASYAVSDAAGGLSGLAFSDDGARYYISDQADMAIHQFDLAVPFDPGTAVHAGSADLSAQGLRPTEVNIGDNGTMMYVLGRDSPAVHAYSLGTAYDAGGATFAASLDVDTNPTTLTGMAFAEDGRRLFVLDGGESILHRFGVNDPFNISSATYADSLDISSAGPGTHDVIFSDDGRLMFSVGISDDTVYTFALAAPYDITPSVLAPSVMVGGSSAGEPRGLAVGSDGRFVAAIYRSGEVHWRELAMPHNLATAGPESSASFAGSPAGLSFSPDGSRMHVWNETGTAFEYTFSGAYDPSSAFTVHEQSLGPGGAICGFSFSADGEQVLVAADDGNVTRYDLDAAHLIEQGASGMTGYSFGAGDEIPCGMAPSADGTGLVISSPAGLVHRYPLGGQLDLDSRGPVDSLGRTRAGSSAADVEFSADGTMLYVLDADGSVYQHSMATYSITSHKSVSGRDAFAARETALTSFGVDAADSPAVADRVDAMSENTLNPRDAPMISDGLRRDTSVYAPDAPVHADGGSSFSPATAAPRILSAMLDQAGSLSVLFDRGIDISSVNPAAVRIEGSGNTTGLAGVSVRGGISGEVVFEIPSDSPAMDYGMPRLRFGSGALHSSDGGRFPQEFGLPLPFNSISDRGPLPPSIEAVSFTSDGFFVAAVDGSGSVHAYGLSIPYDLGSASSGGALDLGSGAVRAPTSAEGVFISSDDSWLIVIDEFNGTVYRYELPESPGGTSEGLVDTYAGVDASPAGVALSSDGMHMYTAGAAVVRGFSLGERYDISSAIPVGIFSAGVPHTGVALSDDGRAFFVSTAQGVLQYSLGTPFDILSASERPAAFEAGADPRDVTFSSAGTIMLVTGGSGDVHRYELAEPFDVSASTHAESLADPVNGSAPVGLAFLEGGLVLLVLGDAGLVHTYNLTSPYDIASASPTGELDVSANVTDPLSVAADGSGTRIFVGDGNDELIYQYDAAGPYQAAGAVPAAVSGAVGLPAGMAFVQDGRVLFLADAGGGRADRFVLDPAYDITSPVRDGSRLLNTGGSSGLSGIAFSDDGLRMTVSDGGSGELRAYSVGPAFDIVSANRAGTFGAAAQNASAVPESSPAGIAFSGDGMSMFAAGRDQGAILRYDLASYHLGQCGADSAATGGACSTIYTADAADAPGVSDRSGTGYTRGAIPRFASAVIDGATGELTVAFTREVNASGVDPAGMIIRDGGLSASGLPLSEADYNADTNGDGSVDGSDNTDTLVFDLNNADRVEAAGYENPRLFIDPQAVRGGDGGPLGTVFTLPLPAQQGSSFVNGTGTVGTDAAAFSGDGLRMIAASGGEVISFGLSEPFAVETAVPAGSLSPPDSDVRDIFITSDGLRLFLAGGGGFVHAYELGAGFELSGAAPAGSLNVSVEAAPAGIAVSPDGRRMLIADGQSNRLHEYSMESFDIEDAAYLGLTGPSMDPDSVRFSPNGLILFLLDSDRQQLEAYDLLAPFDAGSHVSAGRLIIREIPDAGSFWLSGDGLSLLVSGGGMIHLYGLPRPFEVEPAADTGSLYVGGESADPTGAVFSPDGRNLFLLDESNIVQYALGTPFDLATANHSGSAFTVGGTPRGIAISPDGTNILTVAVSGFAITYELGAPFDVTGGIEAVASGELAGVIGSPRGLTLSSDGTMAFTTSFITRIVHAYDLPDAYNVTVANPTGTFYLGDGSPFPHDLAFSTDGTRLFIIGDDLDQTDGTGPDAMREYSLGSGYEIRGAEYEGSVTGLPDASPRGLVFSPDGARMFITGTGTDRIYQYALNSHPVEYRAVDSAASVTSALLDARAGELEILLGLPPDISSVQPEKISIRDGGAPSGGIPVSGPLPSTTPELVRFEVGPAAAEAAGYADPRVHFDEGALRDAAGSVLPDPFGIGGAAYYAAADLPEAPNPAGAAFSGDGMALFVAGSVGGEGRVSMYSLESPYNATSAGATPAGTMQVDEISPRGLAFSANGTLLFIVGPADDMVRAYNLAAPYELGATGPSDEMDISPRDNAPHGLAFSADGLSLFVVGQENDAVYRYALNAPYHLNGADSGQVGIGSQDGNPTGVAFSADGMRMFISGNDNDAVYWYSLDGPYEIETFGYGGLARTAGEGTPMDVIFSDDGTRMFVPGFDADAVHEYALGTQPLRFIPGGPELVSALLDADGQLTLTFDTDMAAPASGSIRVRDGTASSGGLVPAPAAGGGPRILVMDIGRDNATAAADMPIRGWYLTAGRLPTYGAGSFPRRWRHRLQFMLQRSIQAGPARTAQT